jgi:phage gpG-like protein
MNVSIDITTGADLQGLFKRAASLPQESLKAIARALNQSSEIIVGNAINDRFVAGKGPFPVSEHKLGRKTGRLRQSIFSTAPQIQEGSSTVTMGFGSNVKYFAIHEFGGTINLKARTQINHFKFLADGKGARFSKVKGATHAQKNQIGAHSYIMPARAPMQTELRHPRTAQLITEAATREILKVIDQLEKGGAA